MRFKPHDHTKPYRREPDYAAEMRLPEGKTCADCFHGPRCDGLFGALKRGFTSCDFWPRRYIDKSYFEPEKT